MSKTKRPLAEREQRHPKALLPFAGRTAALQRGVLSCVVGRVRTPPVLLGLPTPGQLQSSPSSPARALPRTCGVQ
eukprot:2988663-Pyramimonas_sp.AAC.1